MVWTNICKIGTVQRNPEGYLFERQRSLVIETLRLEIRNKGVGISGMRERLRQSGGTMNIESDSAGTRILATTPVPKAASTEDQSQARPLRATASDF
jgi:hypothetical protein